MLPWYCRDEERAVSGRDAAGPWYRFTAARGLQPCPAEDAIAALNRSAERHCAGDRDMIAEIVSF